MKKIIIALMTAALLAGCSAANTKPKPKLKTLAGKTVDFARLEGHPVIINYWADWCGPCKKEIPALNAYAKKYPKTHLLAVNYDGVDEAALKKLIIKNNIHYESLKADPAEALALGDIPGIPVSFVFNAQGELVRTLYGPQTLASLSELP